MSDVQFPGSGGVQQSYAAITQPLGDNRYVHLQGVKLAANYTAGGTTLTVDQTVPPYYVGRGYVAVEVGTANCEIIAATFNGKTVTLTSALALSHAAGVQVVPFQDQRVPIEWFGGVGDGVTDDTAAWQQALLETASAGGPLWVSGGLRGYVLSYPLMWPTGAQVERVGTSLGFSPSKVAPTGTLTLGSTTASSITGSQTGIQNGMPVTGTAVAQGTFLVSGAGTSTWTLSRPAIGSGTSQALSVWTWGSIADNNAMHISFAGITGAYSFSGGLVQGPATMTGSFAPVAGQGVLLRGQMPNGAGGRTPVSNGHYYCTQISGTTFGLASTPLIALAANLSVTGTLNGTTAVSSVTGSQTGVINGQLITGTNIPAGTILVSGAGTSSWVLSQAATGSGTGVTLIVSSADIDTADTTGATGTIFTKIVGTGKLTCEQVFTNCRNAPGVNGAAFTLQQPTSFHRLRFDNQQPITWATLSSTLNPGGGNISTLPINAAAVTIPPGQLRTVADSGQWQVWQTVGYTPAGSTSINVVPQTPGFAFSGASAPVSLTGDVTNGSKTVANVTGSQTGIVNGNLVTGTGIPTGTTIASGAGTTTWTLSANATGGTTGEALSVTIATPITNVGFGLFLGGQEGLFTDFESTGCETAVVLDDASYMDFFGRFDIESFTFRAVHVRPASTLMAALLTGGGLNCTFNPCHFEIASNPGIQAVFDLEGPTDCFVIGTSVMSWTPPLPKTMSNAPAYVWCHAGSAINSGYQLLGQQPRIVTNVTGAGFKLVNDSDRGIIIDMFTDLNTRGIMGFDAGRLPAGSTGNISNVRQIIAGPNSRILKLGDLNKANPNIDSTPDSGQTGPSVVFRDTGGAAGIAISPDGRLQSAKGANQVTGSGTTGLGTNCPAVTPGAVTTWLKIVLADGSDAYIPVWK